MKFKIGMLLICILIGMTGCQRKAETYVSQREKTADMQDLKIQQMKRGQTGLPATEPITEAPAVEITEPPQAERVEPETEPLADERDLIYPVEVALTGDLNMRDGPGEEYQVIHSLEEGDELEVIGKVHSRENEPWYRIVFNGERGYADAMALSLVTDIAQPE